MNVIFTDIDGTLLTDHFNTMEDVERRVAVLADICKEYDCKVVLEAALKRLIDPYTLETSSLFINKLYELFSKYNIELIGITPCVEKKITDYVYYPMWKEYEIRKYLFRHPEIEHFCIIDDDDNKMNRSDLDMLRDHLVTTIKYSKDNPSEEGLLLRHKEEVGKILKSDNKIKKFAMKKKTPNEDIY